MNVLDKGFVELVDFMGGDLRVVNSAKVSFHKESVSVGESEGKLIDYLMKHRHGSPFEHSYFTFRVKAPIFVTREWQRHRIGSFNEMSGRYVEFDPEFYLPSLWRVPAASNKQGSVVDPAFMYNDYATEVNKEASDYAYRCYNQLLRAGVAKEMARMVLPLSLYTEFYWTINARSLMNFLSLRTGADAQWEIREYANCIESFFMGTMPLTHRSWVKNDRLAP
jgi:thymidylate synthase (FAD)